MSNELERNFLEQIFLFVLKRINGNPIGVRVVFLLYYLAISVGESAETRTSHMSGQQHLRGACKCVSMTTVPKMYSFPVGSQKIHVQSDQFLKTRITSLRGCFLF